MGCYVKGVAWGCLLGVTPSSGFHGVDPGLHLTWLHPGLQLLGMADGAAAGRASSAWSEAWRNPTETFLPFFQVDELEMDLEYSSYLLSTNWRINIFILKIIHIYIYISHVYNRMYIKLGGFKWSTWSGIPWIIMEEDWFISISGWLIPNQMG